MGSNGETSYRSLFKGNRRLSLIIFLGILIGFPEAAINEYSFGLIKINGIPIFFTDLFVVGIILISIIHVFYTNYVSYITVLFLVFLFTFLQIYPIFIGVLHENNFIDIIQDFRGTIYLVFVWSFLQLFYRIYDKKMPIIKPAIILGSIIFSLWILFLYVFLYDKLYLVDGRTSYKSLSILVIASFILFDEIMKGSNKRLIYLLALVITNTVLLLGGFRILIGFELGGMAVILLLNILQHKSSIVWIKYKPFNYLLIIFLIFVIALLLFEKVRSMLFNLVNRFLYVFMNLTNDYSLVTRFNDIRSTLKLLGENIYVGSGYGTRVILSTSGASNLFIDNLYFTLLFKQGIILFPIIIGLYFLFFCVMLYRSKEIVGYLTVVILVILGSLFGSGIWYDHTLPLVVSLLLAELHLTSGYLNQAKRNIIR